MSASNLNPNNPNTFYTIIMKLNRNFLLQELAGYQLLVDVTQDRKHGVDFIKLNETAQLLYNKFSRSEDFGKEDMVSLLMNEYEIDRDVAEQDISETIETWRNMKIIVD